MNASGVRTLVPAGAWRASSVRGGHTTRASFRAPLQTCIPTPRTERHTPVPRGDLRSISPSVPTFHGSRTARVKGRLEREVDRTPKFALDPELRLPSQWRVHGTGASAGPYADRNARSRSEEHTSELQSHSDLVCRLLLEKKKKKKNTQKQHTKKKKKKYTKK